MDFSKAIWCSLALILFQCVCPGLSSEEFIDLEKMKQDFVLETKKIEIEDYPEALNASIIRWKGSLLMSFRLIPDRKSSFTSLLGLIWLDDDFTPIGEPQVLNTREGQFSSPSRAEDARLLTVGDRLFIVYDDNIDKKISKGGFRIHIAELIYDGEKFAMENIERISRYEGESKDIREKSWVPFDYKGNLLLAYSLQPHKIFRPLFGRGECQTIASTSRAAGWNWGLLRGGTPALEVDGQYLAFFHSSQSMATLNSNKTKMLHYFMGAYTFNLEPPFEITKISPEPIVGEDFYVETGFKPYWKPVKAVFPCGYIVEEDYIWVSYGRDDHEIWVVKLDKKGLLRSLVDTSNM